MNAINTSLHILKLCLFRSLGGSSRSTDGTEIILKKKNVAQHHSCYSKSMPIRGNQSFYRWLSPLLTIPITETSSNSDSNNHSGSNTPTQGTKQDDLSHMAPTLPIIIFQLNSNLQVAFDTRTRTPVYALERLYPLPLGCNNKNNNNNNNNNNNKSNPKIISPHRRPNFHEEIALPEAHRSRNSHYKNSGYDRGHMAPAADFNSHDPTTFVLTNVCPQHSGLNRTLWAQLEAWVRRVAAHHNHNDHDVPAMTYVMTGPLWLPSLFHQDIYEYRYPALGQPPSLLHVPTHFYKVIVVTTTTTPITNNPSAQDSTKIQHFACFVIPNTEPDPHKSLEDYLVRWTDLEAVLGMTLFPHCHTTDKWKQEADWLTQEVWQLSSNALANSRTSKSTTPSRMQLLGDGSSMTIQQQRRQKPPRRATGKEGLRHLCPTGKCK